MMELEELKTRLLLPKSERIIPLADDICPICGESVINKFVSLVVIKGHERFAHPKCEMMLREIQKYSPEINL
jgi:hypothetical protein